MPDPISIDLRNVQGLVAHAYRLRLCRHLLFTFDAASDVPKFFHDLPPITPADTGGPGSIDQAINVGLSHEGLKAAKVLSEQALTQFPLDFRRPASPLRLHDTPAKPWWNGVPVPELHCLVSLHARTEPARDDLTTQVLTTADKTAIRHRLVKEGGGTIDGEALDPPGLVHFGYVDGLSGPTVAWSDPAAPPNVDFRHFLLGHSSDAIESSPFLGEAADFARDGSYAAFRVMYQDVAAFNHFLAAKAGDLAPTLGLSPGEAEEWLAARLLGRWRDGRPLTAAPNQNDVADALAEFDYSADKKGERCPFSAHVRVTNPRDQVIDDSHMPLPRLLRRGMPYGKPLTGAVDDGKDRGLIGLFFCSRLSFQFEKVMDWINRNDFSPVFSNLHAQDPLLGNRDLQLASTTFTIPKPGGAVKVKGLPTFVRGWGTAYFLFPSLAALDRVAGRTG